jgi:hypothetical protein
MTVTLLQLRTRSRQRADMENSDFITDAELNAYINASVAELHDLLVAAYGEDYFLADPHSITTVADTTDYNLPSDFYKLKGVDCRINNSQWFSLRPFNFNERNSNQDFRWAINNGPAIRYRVMGSKIKLSPAPDAAHTIKLWYVPTATTLSADADTLNDINNFSEYVIVDAAIKMLQKEDSDVSVLMMQKQALQRRLEVMSNNRDAGQPEAVSDIYAEDNNFWDSE